LCIDKCEGREESGVVCVVWSWCGMKNKKGDNDEIIKRKKKKKQERSKTKTKSVTCTRCYVEGE